MSGFWNIITIIVFLLGSVPSFAAEKVKVSVVPQYSAFHQGQNMGMLVKFEIAPDWHIFSQNPGEIGMPTSIKWTLPQGFAVLDGNWSQDKEFENSGIIQRGYADLAYFQTAIIPNQMSVKNVKIDLEIKWLACNVNCYPESKTISIDIPVSEFEQFPSHIWDDEFKTAQTMFAPQQTDNKPSLLMIVLMAFWGGIIINAMPCIFPILAIKVMNLISAPQSKRQSILKALAYSGGVIISFMIIATIMLVLRSAGVAIGWGFQLQSPIFVGFMIVLFIIIGLLLLDIITLNSPITRQLKISSPILSSLATGFLAVLVATPCTAPFMGIAIGYALNAPISSFYPVFLSLSIGYAFPFALAEVFPNQIKKILPSSGKWMEILKKLFAIPVFLTAIWLGWVLYNQLGTSHQQDIQWKNYDREQVEQLVKNNENVFINFTAKWCLTCIVNKNTSLQTKEFQNLVKKHDIKLFEADWTNNNPQISDALAMYGRNSVPLYVFYKNGKYHLLPQILTPNIVKNAID